jgi:TetR/AcrR family transcriptional regulator, transcriptional repressor for nem operon
LVWNQEASLTSRPVEPSTRERLLDAAVGLSLERGFADTTVADVCERAELTKGAFFHYFDGKEAMGKAVLEHWIANGAANYSAAPFWNLSDPLERLYGYIDFTSELTVTGPCGCLVGIYSQELWQSQPELRADCEAAFSAWADGLARLVAEARDRHAPKASFDPRSLAYHFIAVFEGGLILARAHRRPEIVGEQLEHFKRYVQSLFAGELTGPKRKEGRRAEV